MVKPRPSNHSSAATMSLTPKPMWPFSPAAAAHDLDERVGEDGDGRGVGLEAHEGLEEPGDLRGLLGARGVDAHMGNVQAKGLNGVGDGVAHDALLVTLLVLPCRRAIQKRPGKCPGLLDYGGDKGVRTPDLVTASHALSQLSYIPEVVGDAGFEPATPSV